VKRSNNRRLDMGKGQIMNSTSAKENYISEEKKKKNLENIFFFVSWCGGVA
jgi:hypothetical protein